MSTAFLDESSTSLAGGGRLYGIAAVLTANSRHDMLRSALQPLLLAGQSYVHHYDDTPRRRCTIAAAIAALPFDGAIIITETTTNQTQERARRRLLTTLLPRLEHAEHVNHVLIESRAQSDRHDQRTRDQLRRSHTITATLRVDHAPKTADVLLSVADYIVGSWFAARHHADTQPWKIITSAHYVDVVPLHDAP